MKKVYLIVFACLLATIMMGSAFAGQEPYVAVVDEDTAIDPFYISPKLYQFTHPNTDYSPESFLPQNTLLGKQYEVCDRLGTPHNVNYKTGKGNSGWYRWQVVLPKKLEGNINLVLECGILKPNSYEILGKEAIDLCAGETGEVLGSGFCTRKEHSDLKQAALPKITAKAYPGPDNGGIWVSGKYTGGGFTPFNLTAYKNPGNYNLTKDSITGWLTNSSSLQVLDGSANARIALKACMDKTIFVKMPKQTEDGPGEYNALGQEETELFAGDVIFVEMNIPNSNTVDVYCNKYSLKVMGLGEPGVADPYSVQQAK